MKKKTFTEADGKKFLSGQKFFCILPWIHLCIYPSAKVFTCCAANFKNEIGNLNDSSLDKIWNSERITKLRRRMLKNLPCRECERCYEEEENGLISLRRKMNERFKHCQGELEKTKKDGSLADINWRYLDVRFSNECNFRCRTCGPYLSSSWCNEEKGMYGGEAKLPSRLKLNKQDGSLWEFIEKSLPVVEEIYFAGGEPLLSDEHYEILEKLLAIGKKDVKLLYNTNFSSLSFKGRDIFKYWNKFDNVLIAASLDAMKERGEYIRKGQNWIRTEKNMMALKKNCPQVKFLIFPTISIFNVWHLPDFHKYLVANGFISINDIRLNILFHPVEYRVQVLPKKYKKLAKVKLLEHLKYLRKNKGTEMIIAEFKQLLKFMEARDLSDKIDTFLSKTKRLDKIRGEEFFMVFPEWKGLSKR